MMKMFPASLKTLVSLLSGTPKCLYIIMWYQSTLPKTEPHVFSTKLLILTHKPQALTEIFLDHKHLIQLQTPT